MSAVPAAGVSAHQGAVGAKAPARRTSVDLAAAAGLGAGAPTAGSSSVGSPTVLSFMAQLNETKGERATSTRRAVGGAGLGAGVPQEAGTSEAIRRQQVWSAVSSCSLQSLRTAVEAGHGCNFVDESQASSGSPICTPLMVALSWQVNGQFDQDQCVEALQLLLKGGADVNWKWSKESNSFLFHAFQSPSDRVCEAVLAAKPDVNVRNRGDDTVLMEMAATGKATRVQQLLSAGAEVGLTNSRGDTALHFATTHGSEPVVQLLLQAKADPDQKNKSNHSPLDVARQMRNGRLVALLEAAAKQQTPSVAAAQPPTQASAGAGAGASPTSKLGQTGAGAQGAGSKCIIA
jgi:hypothetical protein